MRNDELDSHIPYPHQYWLAKLKSKESQQAIVDLPKMSIAHLTFFFRSRARLLTKKGLSSNATTED